MPPFSSPRKNKSKYTLTLLDYIEFLSLSLSLSVSIPSQLGGNTTAGLLALVPLYQGKYSNHTTQCLKYLLCVKNEMHEVLRTKYLFLPWWSSTTLCHRPTQEPYYHCYVSSHTRTLLSTPNTPHKARQTRKLVRGSNAALL